jgi:hypothetical protein
MKTKEMVIFSHTDGLMKEPFDMVDEHIDIFIQTGRRRWDFGRLIFDRDPIYDIEGSPQEKGFELSSSEDYFSCIYDSYVWEPDDDMITDLFEDSQPPSSSILEEYQDVATSERSEAHSTKRKYFHIEDFYKDSKIKRAHFSLPRPELSLTSFPLLREIMRSSWDLSYLLSLQEAMIMLMRMKMSLRLHIVSPFRDGLIRACGYHFRKDSLDDELQIFFPTGFPPSHPSP